MLLLPVGNDLSSEERNEGTGRNSSDEQLSEQQAGCPL